MLSVVPASPGTPQSKTSLETLVDCEYKYGQVYLCGKRAPRTVPNEVGLLVHKRIEDWRNTGVLPDPTETWGQYTHKHPNGVETTHDYQIGAIALEMIKLLPAYGTPGIGTEVDETFEIEGYPLRAIADWTQSDPLTLGDLKTTSNVEAGHILTPSKFLRDIQAILSARHMDADLWLDWTYGQTKPTKDEPVSGWIPKTKKVRLRVLKEEVKQAFHEVVEPLIVKAQAILEQNDPESLPKNKSSCTKYGWVNRCHLYSHCHPKQRSEVVGSSLLEQLRKSAGANNQVTELVEKVLGVAEPQPEINPPKVAAAPPPEPEPEIAKKPRGRPRKDTPPQPMPVTNGHNKKPIRVLYVDCVPLSQQAMQAHVLIAKAADQVCADMGVLNIRLIDYAKGGACLSAQLEADIKKMEPGFDLVLQSRTVEGREVYHTLLALAENVVVAL